MSVARRGVAIMYFQDRALQNASGSIATRFSCASAFGPEAAGRADDRSRLSVQNETKRSDGTTCAFAKG
jgi:hypothetical protein